MRENCRRFLSYFLPITSDEKKWIQFDQVWWPDDVLPITCQQSIPELALT